MLAGRYADARIAELRPRIACDRLDGTIAARPGAARLVAQSGGTIPDRGYFQLRIEESNARLGELDEEFVWERSLGDTFLLGTQSWRIHRITSNEVFVAPARGGAMLAPFWRADARDRGAVFSERIGLLLERADRELELPGFEAALAAEYALDAAAATELTRLLREARAALGGALPHRHRLVFEETLERAAGASAPGDEGRRQVVLYTFWGGTLNRPLALALAAAWEEAEGQLDRDPRRRRRGAARPAAGGRRARALHARDAGASRGAAAGATRSRRASSAPSSARTPSARCSCRAPVRVVARRSGSRARTPRSCSTRWRDSTTFRSPLETWRSSLHDEFDLDTLRLRLEEVGRGEIELRSVRSERPSPLAAGLVWRRTNELMYEDDVPGARRGSSVRGDLLREVALGGERPRIAPRAGRRAATQAPAPAARIRAAERERAARMGEGAPALAARRVAGAARGDRARPPGRVRRDARRARGWRASSRRSCSPRTGAKRSSRARICRGSPRPWRLASTRRRGSRSGCGSSRRSPSTGSPRCGGLAERRGRGGSRAAGGRERVIVGRAPRRPAAGAPRRRWPPSESSRRCCAGGERRRGRRSSRWRSASCRSFSPAGRA